VNARVILTLLWLTATVIGAAPPAPTTPGKARPLTLSQAIDRVEKARLGAVIKAEVRGSAFVLELDNGVVVTIEQGAAKPDDTGIVTKFRKASDFFKEGNYRRSEELLEEIITATKDPEYHMDALGRIVQCRATRLDDEAIRAVVRRMVALLPKLSPKAREPWEIWIETVKQDLRPQAADPSPPGPAGPAKPPPPTK
jgi:hypothetical protein